MCWRESANPRRGREIVGTEAQGIFGNATTGLVAAIQVAQDLTEGEVPFGDVGGEG